MKNTEAQMFKSQFQYYLSIIQSSDPEKLYHSIECNANVLEVLVVEAINNTELYPSHKLNRWLGYVQGVLISSNVLSVSIERERTRPIFHGIYGIGVSFDATSI